MADTPPDPADTPRRPPVHMGLRVLARHGAGRHGGRHLAHAVVEARAPKLLPASMRLAEPARARAAAPPAPPPPAPAVARPPPPRPGGAPRSRSSPCRARGAGRAAPELRPAGDERLRGPGGVRRLHEP